MPRTAEEEANASLATRFVQRVFGEGDLAAIDELARQDYIQHSPFMGDSLAALREFVTVSRARFPDAKVEVKRALADGDHVLVHWHAIRFAGDPGHAIMDLFRVTGGLLAEHWESVQEVPPHMPHDNGMF